MANHHNSVMMMPMVAAVMRSHDNNAIRHGRRYRRYRYCKKYCKCDESFHSFISSRSYQCTPLATPR